jgi:hypothetical protein
LFDDGDFRPGVSYIGSFSCTPEWLSFIGTKEPSEAIKELNDKRTAYYNSQRGHYSKYYKLKYLNIYKKFQEADSIAKSDLTYA